MPRDTLRPRPPPPADDWALFLDVDGSLIEFADAPDAVTVPDALPVLLERLARRLDGALALVSGRAIASLDALFAPLQLASAGLHGLERRSAAASRAAPARPDAFDHVHDEARLLAEAWPGALV
ncbi:MAG TPA: trehalose-phosphatase, partial [Xanthomonadaceae bacterium]|nr:trehalose-phosphatase [Xanthomonadaceae bacterium]